MAQYERQPHGCTSSRVILKGNHRVARTVMSQIIRSRRKDYKRQAAVFAALGDETRLVLLARLCGGQQMSITQLTSGLPVTRQAITKHLRVLEGAGIVRGIASGRETLFELHPRPL